MGLYLETHCVVFSYKCCQYIIMFVLCLEWYICYHWGSQLCSPTVFSLSFLLFDFSFPLLFVSCQGRTNVQCYMSAAVKFWLLLENLWMRRVLMLKKIFAGEQSHMTRIFRKHQNQNWIFEQNFLEEMIELSSSQCLFGGKGNFLGWDCK